MKKKTMKQNKIAKLAEKSPATISRWFNGSRRIGSVEAELLEKITGVKKLAWLYPSQYFNPYIQIHPPSVAPSSDGL